MASAVIRSQSIMAPLSGVELGDLHHKGSTQKSTSCVLPLCTSQQRHKCMTKLKLLHRKANVIDLY